MSKGKGFFGWLFGLLAGTLLGVLFAPRKGSEVRQRIRTARKGGKKGHEPFLQDMKLMGQEMAETAKDLYHSEDVQEVIRRGRHKVKELGSDIVDELQDFQRYNLGPAVKVAKKKMRQAEKDAKRMQTKAGKVMRKAKRAGEVAKKAASDLKRSLSDE